MDRLGFRSDRARRTEQTTLIETSGRCEQPCRLIQDQQVLILKNDPILHITPSRSFLTLSLGIIPGKRKRIGLMSQDIEHLGEVITAAIPALLTALEGMDAAQQGYHPARPAATINFIAPFTESLNQAHALLAPLTFPEPVAKFGNHLKTSFLYATRTCENLNAAADDSMAFLRASRTFSKALDQLFPLATLLNPIHQFFLETPLRTSASVPEHFLSEASHCPIIHIENAYDQRGGASVYIPHWVDPNALTPVVIALHGGAGHGRDMLWSWLREARSRGFVLIAPTSSQDTWQLNQPEQELPALLALLQFVKDQIQIDPTKILLSGLSDGATLTLQLGLQPGTPFTHLAPFSGTLDPALVNPAVGLLHQDKPIYLVHGSDDWMFPVAIGQMTAEVLGARNPNLIYNEIEGLGHTFARTALKQLLPWFSAACALEQ